MTPVNYAYGKQSLDPGDELAVLDVLRGDWLTQGPHVQEFEEHLCKELRASHATAVANGTAGLHLIGLALSWKPGDVVITTPITFLASANCIVYAGATPDFVDIDQVTYTIDTALLEERILTYRASGVHVKAVVAVDFAGHPCDWAQLRVLADRYGFQLVNDNCHALGAMYGGDPGYAAAFADAVNLSFHPVKHITTGEGGAIVTNSAELDQQVKILRSHGMTKDPALLERQDGPWYYEMIDLGFNYRITDFQCALGSSQLRKLSSFVERRRQIAARYDAAFAGDSRFIIPSVRPGDAHAYHLYPLQFRLDLLGMTKLELYQRLKENGILCQVHYIPVHTQPYYRKHFGFSQGMFPVSEAFYEKVFSIPMYPGLTDEDVDLIISRIQLACA